MSKMNMIVKLGIVLGGYIAACIFAGVIVYINQLFNQDAASHTSAGMYAFGDFIFFIGLLGFLALFPTGLVL